MAVPNWKSPVDGSVVWTEAVAYTTGVYVPSSITTLQPSQAPAGLPDVIIATTSGVVVGQLETDSADKTYPVNVGVNKLRFKRITQAGTVAGLFVGSYSLPIG